MKKTNIDSESFMVVFILEKKKKRRTVVDNVKFHFMVFFLSQVARCVNVMITSSDIYECDVLAWLEC